MKSITLSLLLTAISFQFFSQDFEVPKKYKLEKAEDYTKYEQDVINCVDWIQKTPYDEQTYKRNDANKFLITWLTGSPTVSVEIKMEIVTFMESTPDLLIIFMGSWAKFALETKEFDNKVGGSLAGINAVIDFYEKNKKELSKDKNVEKYIKMKENGTLNSFIEKNA